MGRIFTPEQLAEDQVPKPQAFREAAAWLLDKVYSAQAPFTDGALIFGSTTTSRATPRSDLDVLLCYDDDKALPETALEKYKTLFDIVYDKWQVPVEPIVCSSSDLLAGRHTLDPLFLPHLRAVDHNVWGRGINPARLAEDLKIDPRTVFDRYVLHKEGKFKKALLGHDPIEGKVLQRALELSSALGRKALGLLVGQNEANSADYHSVSKRAVTEQIQLLAPKSVGEAIADLERTDQLYEYIVEAVQSGSITPDRYRDWLGDFATPAVQRAYAYARELSAFVAVSHH